MVKALVKDTLQKWFRELIIDSNIIPTFISKQVFNCRYDLTISSSVLFDSQGMTIDYFPNLEITLGMTLGFTP